MAKFTTKVFSKVKNIQQPYMADVICSPVDVDFPAVNYAVGDIIEVAEIPAGVTLQDYSFMFPKIDGNATPTLTFSFGVLNPLSTDLATVYEAGIQAGRVNTPTRGGSTDPAQADSTVIRRLGLKVTAVAATYAGANKTGQMLLELRG